MSTVPQRKLKKFAVSSAVVLTVAGGVLAASTSATGSTPNSGTLSGTSGPVNWSGGPFLVPNTTGTALGAPDCTAPQSCDDFTLTVSTPAGTGDTENLTIKTSWPNASADFDVYVFDAAGNQVGVSASSADPETVVMAPTSGTYTVRVVPFLPLGQSYTATAALTAKPSDTAPSSNATPPTFANYSPPSSFTDSDNAGEPSIGVDPTTNAALYQAGLSTFKATFSDATNPATASWADVTANAADGCPQGDTTSLDPILYTDRVTGRTFESQLSGVDSLTCYTDNDGANWKPSQGGGIPSGVDHQTLGGGPFAASDPLNTVNSYPRAVYYCSQDIATAFCALSRDGGQTFGAGIPTYNLNDCGGLHGHIGVAPDGTAYLPNKSCDGHQAVVVSGDDGQSWAIRTVPNSIPGDTDPAVSLGANGTVYLGYANGDGTPHVAVSHDQGKSWAYDYNVGASLGIKNVVFPTIVAGDDDRAAMSFLGTTTAGNYQDSANFTGIWYLYTAFTYDGGQTWTTVNDTPNDPVQRGSICTAGTTCGNDRNLLDFIGSTVDTQGRVLVAYADGCINACITDPSQNGHDAYATIARQAGGLSLFSANDPKPNLVVSGLSTKIAKSGASSVTVTMKNVGDGVAKGAQVSVLVDGTPLAVSPAGDLTAGQSTTFTTPWNTKGLKGSHTVAAVADPSNTVAESDEADNKVSTTVTF
jgi:archaellum component FlaF (FlaF/FlaG flagellin family)